MKYLSTFNIQEQVVDIALEYPDKSPRELAWIITVNEALDNLKPADVYYGRGKKIITQREVTKEQTLQTRRVQNLGKTVNEILLDYEKCIS